jgi:hypothetical protein
LTGSNKKGKQSMVIPVIPENPSVDSSILSWPTIKMKGLANGGWPLFLGRAIRPPLLMTALITRPLKNGFAAAQNLFRFGYNNA